MMRILMALLAAALVAGLAFAQGVSEAEVNTRTEAVAKTLRCVVCQNQTINESPTPLAEDMKKLVRTRIIAGDSDDEVREYMRARYGDYVLMTPPFQMNTWFLWLGPFVLIAGMALWFIWRVRARATAGNKRDVNDDERARIQAALYGDDVRDEAKT
jgi:cytochrome c-type biogenesis protein CcmH